VSVQRMSLPMFVALFTPSFCTSFLYTVCAAFVHYYAAFVYALRRRRHDRTEGEGRLVVGGSVCASVACRFVYTAFCPSLSVHRLCSVPVHRIHYSGILCTRIMGICYSVLA
jgi:hypothetical protein